MKLFAIALALVCCGGAAHADWKYTKWGMTPAEVAGAAQNRTQKSSDLNPDSDGNVTKLVAPYQGGKFPIEAQFGFDHADKLSSVTLVMHDKVAGMDMGDDLIMPKGGCHDLQASIKTSYGPPQTGRSAHMQYSIQIWRDQKSKNNITYTVLDGVGCYVQYSALKPAGAR